MHCKQSFNCNPYVKNSKKFCSKECMQAYRMQHKIIVQCVSCNKDILCSKTRPRKFCSGSCRNNFNNKVIKGTRSKVEILFERELNLKFSKLEFNLNDRQILNGLELDFYFPSLSAAVEFNGVWHLKPIRGEEKLKATQQRDIVKAIQCKEKNIKLLTLVDEKSSQKSIQLQVNTAIKFVEKIISNCDIV